MRESGQRKCGCVSESGQRKCGCVSEREREWAEEVWMCECERERVDRGGVDV